MNTQNFLFILRMLLACLVVVANASHASLQQKDKQSLAHYSLAILKGKNAKTKPEDLAKEVGKLKNDYNYFYMSFFEHGNVLCSKGLPFNKEPLNVAVEKITKKCIEEKRFKKKEDKDSFNNINIVFHFLKQKKELKSNKLEDLEKEVSLGVHGLELKYDKKSTVHGGSLPTTYELGLEETLVSLCLNMGLENDCFEKKEAKVYRYDTETFKINNTLEVVDLYRYNSQEPKSINPKLVMDAIKNTETWYFNHVDPESGMLEHVYYPNDDDYGEMNDHLGQLGSAFALLEANNLTKNAETPYLVRRTLDYYLGFLFTHKDKKSIAAKEVSSKDSIFMLVDGKAKLPYNALLINNLLYMPTYPNQKNLIAALAQGILDQQQKDGSYQTYFACTQNTEVNEYPGEAMLSLMFAYEKTKQKNYLSSVQKGFKFYRSYWRKNKNKPFVPRHTQVYARLYQYTKDKELPQFIFEMNDWLISEHQVKKHQYKDMVGGFSKDHPESQTSLYANGINDAYELAVILKDKKRESAYKDSLKAASRYILQTQFTPENSFYLRAADKAVGGFRGSLLETEERTEEAQQALRALLKTARNKIF